MKRFIDEGFLNNKLKYFLQCLIVTLFLLVILLLFDFVLKLSLVASIGATCFIIFTGPHKNASKYHYILGGYSVGAIMGTLCSIAQYNTHLPVGMWGAFAIGLSVFFMVVLNFEHPPAAAFALSIVSEGFAIQTLFVAFSIVGSMLIVRKLLRGWLIDLI